MEVVILTRKKVLTLLPILIGELTIESRSAIKYLGLMRSVLLYRAEVWADALRKVYRRYFIQVQRPRVLRVASDYRTVSKSAVMLIGRVIPVAAIHSRKVIFLQNETRGTRGR